MYNQSFLKWILVLIIIGSCQSSTVFAQDTDEIQSLLNRMSTSEKIGQLFIVPFVGTNTDTQSDISILIRDYKIGGVVLQSSNSNFRNSPNTPKEIAQLTNTLQGLALANLNVPLFVAVDQEGDDWPYSRIIGGVTSVPSQMSIGATWNQENARAIGNIIGRELSAMGFNMVLGPVLDVLNDPRPTGRGDIGTRTFGGDPYWVGALGKAYIQGVHKGSNNRIATVAKHFPGHGGSDRLPDYEVSTVDKSLQELRRIELAPFFAVTNMAFASEEDVDGSQGSSVTDAMMSSHIRYRGLQGDIRRFTAPISFDKLGMETLLQLPEFEAWRRHHGLIISDALGVPAVRKHFDPTLQTFPHKQIALEAFLAGNDVLILSQFDLDSIWQAQFENIKDTATFFQKKYEEDQGFAQRVDQSVTRILQLKRKLAPNPSPNALVVDGEVALAASGKGQDIVQNIARESLTLLYPTPEDYQNRVPRPPAPHEKILIISDVRHVRACFQSDCAPFEPLAYRGIEDVLLAQYGPQATGQIIPENVASMSFAELKQVLVGSLVDTTPHSLGGENRSPDEVRALIQEAQWIIFAMLDLDTKRFPNSNALKRFLEEELDTLDKNLIVFALNSPYYLDTTEINKLTAYFGLYSKTRPHLEVAIQALFGQATFNGTSPVSVEGIRYDLPDVLSPDTVRSIPLKISRVENPTLSASAFLNVQAGPILDQNGHPVPDGTPVEIDIRYGTGGFANMAVANTVDGQIKATINLTEQGSVEIRARSGEAQSHPPQIVAITFPPTATPPLPTPSPIASSTATPTASPTLAATIVPSSPIPTATQQPTPPLPIVSTVDAPPPSPNQKVTGWDFLTAILSIMVTSMLGIFLGQGQRPTTSNHVRFILIVFIGGMVGYLLYGIGWLRPDVWFIPEATLMLKRIVLAGIVLVFGILGNIFARPFR